MKKQTLVRIAGQSILKNKMRTLLTMLGIVIGVGAVIIMVAIGHGAQSNIEKQIGSLGTNLIVVTAGASQQGGAKRHMRHKPGSFLVPGSRVRPLLHSQSGPDGGVFRRKRAASCRTAPPDTSGNPAEVYKRINANR